MRQIKLSDEGLTLSLSAHSAKGGKSSTEPIETSSGRIRVTPELLVPLFPLP